jgi:hypothetical protein
MKKLIETVSSQLREGMHDQYPGHDQDKEYPQLKVSHKDGHSIHHRHLDDHKAKWKPGMKNEDGTRLGPESPHDTRNHSGRLKMSPNVKDEDLGRKKAQKEALDHIKKHGLSKPVDMHPTHAYATQEFLHSGKNRVERGESEHMPGSKDHPIVGVTPNGKRHILDGHHRIDDAVRLKHKSIKVHEVPLSKNKYDESSE